MLCHANRGPAEFVCPLQPRRCYDKAVIVAGDGDYYCLAKYLRRQKQLFKIIVPDRYNYSWLLRNFTSDIVFLNGTRSKLEYKKVHKT